MNYICMPRLSAFAPPPRGSIALLSACPVCGATCWDREIPEELEGKAVVKVCVECAIRRVTRTGKVARRAAGTKAGKQGRQERRCG